MTVGDLVRFLYLASRRTKMKMSVVVELSERWYRGQPAEIFAGVTESRDAVNESRKLMRTSIARLEAGCLQKIGNGNNARL